MKTRAILRSLPIGRSDGGHSVGHPRKMPCPRLLPSRPVRPAPYGAGAAVWKRQYREAAIGPASDSERPPASSTAGSASERGCWQQRILVRANRRMLADLPLPIRVGKCNLAPTEG